MKEKVNRMRKVYLSDPEVICTEEAPLPKVEKGWVLAKTLRTGICGTDVHSFFGETIFGNTFPFHIGHEISAVVEECKGKTLTKGDIVVIDPIMSCGVCKSCQLGMEQCCENRMYFGLTGPGGFSEYVYVPEACAIKVDSDDYAAMSLAEPLATVVYGFEKLKLDATKSVLINGVGPIGLMFLQLVVRAGVKQVVASDLNNEKLKNALTAGADFALNPLNEEEGAKLSELCGRGFDVIIDCTGSIKSMQSCADKVAFGGQILLFGLAASSATMEINPFKLYTKDACIMTSNATDWEAFCKAVYLLENGRINTDILIDSVVSVSELEASIRKIAAGETNGKIIIDTTL